MLVLAWVGWNASDLQKNSINKNSLGKTNAASVQMWIIAVLLLVSLQRRHSSSIPSIYLTRSTQQTDSFLRSASDPKLFTQPTYYISYGYWPNVQLPMPTSTTIHQPIRLHKWCVLECTHFHLVAEHLHLRHQSSIRTKPWFHANLQFRMGSRSYSPWDRQIGLVNPCHRQPYQLPSMALYTIYIGLHSVHPYIPST